MWFSQTVVYNKIYSLETELVFLMKRWKPIAHFFKKSLHNLKCKIKSMMRIVFWYLFGVQNITILIRWNQYSNLAIKYKYLYWNSHIKLAWYLLLNLLWRVCFLYFQLFFYLIFFFKVCFKINKTISFQAFCSVN